MRLENRLIVAALVLLTGTCRVAPDEVSIELEVGHPLLFAEGRTWAFCRVPRSSAPTTIAPDTTRVCTVVCREKICKVTSATDASAHAGDLWLKGRVFRTSDDGGEAFIILEPFPITTPRSLRAAMSFESGVTKIVRAYYEYDSAGGLHYTRLGYVGEVRRPPVVWK